MLRRRVDDEANVLGPELEPKTAHVGGAGRAGGFASS
jgi:hypothetical protein